MSVKEENYFGGLWTKGCKFPVYCCGATFAFNFTKCESKQGRGPSPGRSPTKAWAQANAGPKPGLGPSWARAQAGANSKPARGPSQLSTKAW